MYFIQHPSSVGRGAIHSVELSHWQTKTQWQEINNPPERDFMHCSLPSTVKGSTCRGYVLYLNIAWERALEKGPNPLFPKRESELRKLEKAPYGTSGFSVLIFSVFGSGENKRIEPANHSPTKCTIKKSITRARLVTQFSRQHRVKLSLNTEKLGISLHTTGKVRRSWNWAHSVY